MVSFIFQKVGAGVAVGLAIGAGGFAWLSFQNRLPQVQVSITITVIVAWASFFVRHPAVLKLPYESTCCRPRH